MAYIIGKEFSKNAEKHDWTGTQIGIYVTIYYIVLITYALVVALAMRNIWAIVIKQEKYKNTAILFFYIFTLIATTLRFVYVFIYWT